MDITLKNLKDELDSKERAIKTYKFNNANNLNLALCICYSVLLLKILALSMNKIQKNRNHISWKATKDICRSN